MAALQVLVVVLAAVSSVAAQSTPIFGGATSFVTYMTGAISKTEKKTGITSYDSVGSSAGIAGFLSGQYAVGTSDNPMNSSAWTQAKGEYKNMYTIPLLFSSYSILTRKAAGIKLSAAQVSDIYLGKITTWHQVDKKLRGTIIPVARADGSGTTGVITYWLSSTTNGAFPYSGNNPLATSLATHNPNLVSATGTPGMVAAIKSNRNAVGYAQTGAGLAVGLKEAKLLNPAGKYITASDANLEQSIPSTLPGVAKDWANVHLVNQAGAATYPVTSFEYSFWRPTYKGTAFATSSKGLQKLFEYILSTPGQNYGKQFYFTPLPNSVREAQLKDVKKV